MSENLTRKIDITDERKPGSVDKVAGTPPWAINVDHGTRRR